MGATLNGLLLQHTCVCAHSSNWSAKVVECSEPSLGLLIELFCKTHVCVGSNNLSAYPQLTSCATHVCVLTAATESVCQSFSKLPKLQLTCSAPDMCVFRNTHVYSCVCPQQQLAGQPSLVCIQMYSCVCPQQQLAGQPLALGCNPAAIGRPTLACVYSEAHLCMPTAAIGRPFLDPWVQPSIDFF